MIKKSLFATYFVQLYAALINIILIPIYVQILGVEQFGLIGFFILLQNIIMIFDVGISGSLSRQASITKHSISEYKGFLKQFTIIMSIFIVISIIIFSFGYFNNEYIITKWINSNLEKNILSVSVISMFMILSFRYVSTPFRSGLIGLEKHVTLSKLNFIFISLKFPGGLVILNLFDNSIISYFIYQTFVSLSELLAMSFIFILSSKAIIKTTSKSFHALKTKITLKSLLVFSGQLSLLSVTWIIVTQIDKFILSSLLSLKDYAYYTLAITISGVILMFSAPLSQVLMSRLSVLYSHNNMQDYVKLYTKAFSLMSIVMISLGTFIFVFSKSIIFMWTGDLSIANASFYYAKWLALGNTISILMTFVFLLQYSTNQLKKHVIVYLLYSLLLIPISIYIANKFYGEGTAIFWFVHNIIFFIIWGGIVNHKFIKGINSFLWLEILTPTIIISFSIFYFIDVNVDLISMNQIKIGLILSAIGVINILVILSYLYIFKNRIVNKSNKLVFTNIGAINE